MRIAMVASEAAPFVKTGGLGDVMQALPNALSKLKGNCRTISASRKTRPSKRNRSARSPWSWRGARAMSVSCV